MTNSFTHLRAYTHHSLTEGLLDIDELIALAKKNNHQAIALTNLNTMSVSIDFVAKAKEAGIKPILGLDAWIDADITQQGISPSEQKPTRLLLIAENNDGYKRLLELIAKANSENIHEGHDKEEKAFIKQSWLLENSNGLIALTGDPSFGEIPRAIINDDEDKQLEILNTYKSIFKNNLFIEIARFAHKDEDQWIEGAVKLSNKTQIPLIATNAVLFEKRKDFFSHEVHSSIVRKEHVLNPEYTPVATRENYYTSTEEMNYLFEDIPQALTNTNLLAERLNVDIEVGVNHLPNFPIPKEYKNIDEYFIDLSKKGLEKRLEQLFPNQKERELNSKKYKDRLKTEIDIILKMGFPGYFLVVSDFIRWTKSQGLPVGPGRGSGAGSLVAYSLNITDLDPIKYGLLFERFLNPERVSMPDIDVDFSRDDREKTIQYIFDKYGSDYVSQIATFGTLAARAAILGAGRALNYPIQRVREILRFVPEAPGIKLNNVLDTEERFKNIYENSKDAKRLIDLALKIEGTSSNTGVHPGGVLIAPERIDNYAPLMKSKKGVLVTQFDAPSAEKAGLIKFDLLGIKTLDIIHQTVQLINKNRKENEYLDISKIPLNDSKTFDLLQSGDTYAVFQLESKGMQGLLKELKPDKFEDIIAIEALYRPGPMQQIPSFIEGKQNPELIEYPHPDLEDILKETYGVIVYQEQVMQIAQKIAGYSLGGADLLRRAMGKKDAAKMAQEREKFIKGSIQNGYGEEIGSQLFDLMEKFASYGFNKSHAAAYALLSMQTAYLKANYPAEFFAAYMNIEMGQTDRLAEAYQDTKGRDLSIIPPDINLCDAKFNVTKDNKHLTYGLAGIKGLSDAVIDDIVHIRKTSGEFKSIPDFLTRVNEYMRENSRNVSLKSVSQSLINSGAFDKINSNRAYLNEQAKAWIEYISKLNKKKGVIKAGGEIYMPILWNALGKTPIPAPEIKTKKTREIKPPEDPIDIKPWTEIEQLSNEAKVVGFFVTGHPYEAIKKDFNGLTATFPLNEIHNAHENGISPYEPVLISGIIESYKEYTPESGNTMAFITLSDGITSQDVTVFNNVLSESEHKFKEGEFIAIESNIRESKRKNKEGMDIIAIDVYTENELKSLLTHTVEILLPADKLPILNKIIEQYPVKPRSGEDRCPLPNKDSSNLNDAQFGPGANIRIWLPFSKNNLATVELPIKFNASPSALDKIKEEFNDLYSVIYYEKAIFAPEKPRLKNKITNQFKK